MLLSDPLCIAISLYLWLILPVWWGLQTQKRNFNFDENIPTYMWN